ncbi:MAG: NAD(P)-dependent oxidoreductase [Candidatus Hydrogenedentes bacterium]|nr:NAD(P)-dependent oxidoreductase [Candidatus Hydrogenedentota bacterium]
MRRRCILITGTSGRLGSALVTSLAGKHDIVQLSLEEPKSSEVCGVGRVFVGSILDPDVIHRAYDGVDAVIHSAAIPGNSKPNRRTVETNVLGTFHMLEEAGERERVEQFIYISSICWHGLHFGPVDRRLPHYLPLNEAHPSQAIDVYACSKFQAEYWCKNYVERFHKPVVAIRPSYIVPRDLEPTFPARKAQDTPHLHDYVGVGDLVDGIERALDYEPDGGFDRFLFNAEDQWSTTPSRELAERLFPSARLDYEKLNAADGFGAFVDCTHAREKLGWTPKFRCQREGSRV